LDEQRPVFKAKAGRLFSDVDIDSRTGEESGDDKRELSGEHGSSSYAERLCHRAWVIATDVCPRSY
jgi:hypothetical protein